MRLRINKNNRLNIPWIIRLFLFLKPLHVSWDYGTPPICIYYKILLGKVYILGQKVVE